MVSNTCDWVRVGAGLQNCPLSRTALTQSCTDLTLTRSLTHSPTHSLHHSLNHFLTHSLGHRSGGLTQSLSHSPTHSLHHSLSLSITHSQTQSVHLITTPWLIGQAAGWIDESSRRRMKARGGSERLVGSGRAGRAGRVGRMDRLVGSYWTVEPALRHKSANTRL